MTTTNEAYPGIAHDYETARAEIARQSDVMRAQAEQIADLMAQRDRLNEALRESQLRERNLQRALGRAALAGGNEYKPRPASTITGQLTKAEAEGGKP